jgi:DtxR family Mn-dependent transcriptional regulator
MRAMKTRFKNRITPALESYLEMIAQVENQTGFAPLGEVARALGVKPSSAHIAFAALLKHGYVTRQSRGIYHITVEGRRYVQSLGKKHQVLERFLELELGLSNQQAQEQACAAEHLLPDEVIKPLAAYVKQASNQSPTPLFGAGLFAASLGAKPWRQTRELHIWFNISRALLAARRMFGVTLTAALQSEYGL